MKASITNGAWRFALSLALAGLCGCASTERTAGPGVDSGGARGYTATRRVLDVLPIAEGGGCWAATGGGLLRYGEDGTLLRKYMVEDGLTANRLLELAYGPDGTLWIATDRGAFHFDGERFHGYTVEQGLNHNLVHSIAADREGRIFAGTERGVSMLDGERFVPFNDTHEFCRRPTYAIHPSADGSLWFAKENALTQRSSSGEWRVFQRDPLLPGPRARIIHNSVRALTTDDRHHIWIGTHQGLGHFDEQAWRRYLFRERFSRSGGLADNFVETLAWEESGALWIGYGDAKDFEGGAGVTRFKDGEWLHLTEGQGLPDNRVYRIRIGEDGDKWFATARGVSRYRNGRFIQYIDTEELK